MKLQESGEMYLETILVLSQNHANVRSIDICEYMGFSKPSVSRAVNNLKKNGYINIDNNGFISFTTEGKYIAYKIYERHTLITDFLISIGVDKQVANDDACKIEHDISDETFCKIKQFYNRNIHNSTENIEHTGRVEHTEQTGQN